jgi:hypothetical protein
MSALSDARQRIADALSQVDGLTGYPAKPRTAARGQGWPEWSYSEPSTYTGDQATWLVHVVLAAGLEDAIAVSADELVDAVLAQLEDIAEVTRWEPTTLIPAAKGDPTLPCLTFTITTV